MKIIELPVEERVDDVRSLRKLGYIPGVAYRKGENIKISSKLNDFVKACKGSTTAQIFRLVSSNPKLDSRLGVIKEIQVEHLKKSPLHFDIQLVAQEEKVEVEVPVKFVGEAIGVKNSGGILAILKHSILLRCFPMNVPDYIEVNISELDIGDSIHIGEIKLPEGVEYAENLDDPVV
ncbi:MAG: 50S ribosomal protein L25, partial [Deltaproteobacteria bacterium]|nr:50S ribosomal protein L25 [Deltaproteobacteria bacterium]